MSALNTLKQTKKFKHSIGKNISAKVFNDLVFLKSTIHASKFNFTLYVTFLFPSDHIASYAFSQAYLQ